jgi:hypothetical protein
MLSSLRVIQTSKLNERTALGFDKTTGVGFEGSTLMAALSNLYQGSTMSSICCFV